MGRTKKTATPAALSTLTYMGSPEVMAAIDARHTSATTPAEAPTTPDTPSGCPIPSPTLPTSKGALHEALASARGHGEHYRICEAIVILDFHASVARADTEGKIHPDWSTYVSRYPAALVFGNAARHFREHNPVADQGEATSVFAVTW